MNDGEWRRRKAPPHVALTCVPMSGLARGTVVIYDVQGF